MSDDNTVIVRRRNSNAAKMGGVLLGIVTVLAPLGTSYMAYRQARFEAQTSTVQTQNEAEAGYKATKEALEKAAQAIVTLRIEVAELRGAVHVLQQPAPLTSVAPEPPARLSPPVKLKAPAELFGKSLPQSLSEAAQQQGIIDLR